MAYDQNTVHFLYKKLINFYPRAFREQLGESMEQTFNDLYNEHRQQRKHGLFGFVVWTFLETVIGIIQEHIVSIKEMNPMKNILTTLRSPALISLLLVIPFMIMEVVNRRNFNEDFPFMLFFGLWLNLFIISIILFPIMVARRTGNHDMVNPIPTQKSTFLTNPKSTAMISAILFLIPVILSLLTFLGWEPLESLFNGPNPEQLSVFGVRVPSQFIALVLFSLPIAAGIIASRTIVRTLRAGGSLFAHPLHLIIVIVLSFFFIAGVVGLIADQWPCFMGLPNCD